MVNIRRLPLLTCDLIFGLPVLAVISIIHSLWSITYLLAALSLSTGYGSSDDYLLGPVKNTYYLLCLSASVMLYCGFKNNDKRLIRYWQILKLAEYSLIFTGVTLILATFYMSYIIVAIPILGAGWYIQVSIRNGCRELGVELDPISVSTIFKSFKHTNQNQDNPPPYEAVEKTQENLNPLATNTLRFWGFIKIFEFVIICPGVILIVTSSQTFDDGGYDYWNMFWIMAGLGLCFALSVRFVWTIIPKKASNTDVQQVTEEFTENLE